MLPTGRFGIALGLVLAGIHVAVAQAIPPFERYVGLCDASAAVDVGGSHFVVADDERDVLQIYRYGVAHPVQSLDLADYLGNRKSNGKSVEADLEGAARIGDRIYWISSHARTSKGDRLDTHRHRLFYTELSHQPGPATLSPGAGRPFTGLLQSLLADFRYAPLLAAAVKSGPGRGGGLNIEGLSATAAGGLLVGFRGPLPQGLALVAHLLNPQALVGQRVESAQWGQPLLLDLGGRGIRSMERVGAQYVIVAGPSAHGWSGPGPAYVLYQWSGQASEPPVLQQALPEGFHFEAVFAVGEPVQQLMLLSDDGSQQVNGAVACKDKRVAARDTSFRAIRLGYPLTSR
jgi:Protein of unknown function (DUF3616)